MKKLFLLLSLFLTLPLVVHAQGAAPGLYNIKDITIQYVRFTDPKASLACGLTRESVASLLFNLLQSDTIPVTSAADAHPPMLGVAHIDLIPEIATISNDGLDCTSWVSLSAQSHNNLNIPPIETLRSVTILYWHQGVIVNSALATHQRLISDVLQKMGQNFAQEYHGAQPPDLPKL